MSWHTFSVRHDLYGGVHCGVLDHERQYQYEVVFLTVTVCLQHCQTQRVCSDCACFFGFVVIMSTLDNVCLYLRTVIKTPHSLNNLFSRQQLFLSHVSHAVMMCRDLMLLSAHHAHCYIQASYIWSTPRMWDFQWQVSFVAIHNTDFCALYFKRGLVMSQFKTVSSIGRNQASFQPSKC